MLTDLKKRILGLLFSVAAFGLMPAAKTQADEIRLFAAASTTTAVLDIVSEFEKRHLDERVKTSFAASSVLAKQLVNGAPADIFLSASRQWMDYVAARNAVDAPSVVDLLSNRLVLIAPLGAEWMIRIEPGFDLLGVLGGGYLALGDPDHVPAGIYARQALEAMGVWPRLTNRVARAANVRAALVLVERAEVNAGIVYATDAMISRKVVVKGEIPKAFHDPIAYPAALVTTNPASAVKRFFGFLSSSLAQELWKRNGFELANAGSPR